jgi:hypothetical protein
MPATLSLQRSRAVSIRTGMPLASGTPFLDDGDAVHDRQADIEDHRIIRLGFAQIMAFLAIEGLVDHITRLLQGVGKLPVEIDIVFDHQNAHAPPLE